MREGESFHARAVRLDRIDLVVAGLLSRKHDEITAGRPEWKVVVPAGQCDYRFGFEVHDSQPVALRSKSAIDEPLSVRRHRRKAIVIGPASQLTEAAAVGMNQSDLRPTFHAIAWFEKLSVESVEERVKETHAEDD